jgi:hypothetical protein
MFVNVTSSLERHYARSTFLVAGVGVLATGSGRGLGIDESPCAATSRSETPGSFAATLIALSAADRPDSEMRLRQEQSLAGVA